jgi:hypothetical protein
MYFGIGINLWLCMLCAYDFSLYCHWIRVSDGGGYECDALGDRTPQQ